MKQLKFISILAAFIIVLSGCESPNEPLTDQNQTASSEELSLAKKDKDKDKKKSGVNDWYECTDVAPLMTGKRERAGTVTVTNNATTMFVTFTVTGGWTFDKTHLNISRGIFKHHEGNGKINLKEKHASGTSTYTYEIPMQWTTGTKIYIKASAHIKKNKSLDVAYGGKDSKSKHGTWFAFFRYCVKGTPPPAYDISGITYVDENSNGVQDDDEDGFGGVTVLLSNGSSTVSDVNGEYLFSGLSNGSYTVSAQIVSGYTLTTPSSVPVTIAGSHQTVDFGYTSFITPPVTFSISGLVFIDANNNGVQDVGEAPIVGAAITLNNGSSVAADNDGAYAFTGLSNGSYTVTAPAQKSFSALTPLLQFVTIAGSNVTVDFRFRSSFSSVTGKLFVDPNQNGVLDAGENQGLAGITVYISSNQGLLITTTDADGNYSFTDLETETYIIFYDLSGYEPTTPYEVFEFFDLVETDAVINIGFRPVP